MREQQKGDKTDDLTDDLTPMQALEYTEVNYLKEGSCGYLAN